MPDFTLLDAAAQALIDAQAKGDAVTIAALTSQLAALTVAKAAVDVQLAKVTAALAADEAILHPKPAKLRSMLGVNLGDPVAGMTSAAQWAAHFAQFPQLTVARCYNASQVAQARAAGAKRILLSASNVRPDGTAAGIDRVVANFVTAVKTAGLVAGDKATTLHEWNTPDKAQAAHEAAGFGYTLALKEARAAGQAAVPGLLVGAVPTGYGVTSGQCDPYWPGLVAAKPDFVSPDVYAGLNGGNAAASFKACITPVVAKIRAHFPDVPIDFWEMNTTSLALSPAWYAQAALDVAGVTGHDSTIVLFQGHDALAVQNFPAVAAAVKAAGWSA